MDQQTEAAALSKQLQPMESMVDSNKEFLEDLLDNSNFDSEMAKLEHQELVLDTVYSWIDNVSLSKSKKNISRDFSDGSLVAQVIHHYLPTSYKSLIQVHNYPDGNNQRQKYDNWNLLNKKILSKFPKAKLSAAEIKNIVECVPIAIEMALIKIKNGMEAYLKNPPAQVKPNVDKLTENTFSKKGEREIRKIMAEKLKKQIKSNKIGPNSRRTNSIMSRDKKKTDVLSSYLQAKNGGIMPTDEPEVSIISSNVELNSEHQKLKSKYDEVSSKVKEFYKTVNTNSVVVSEKDSRTPSFKVTPTLLNTKKFRQKNSSVSSQKVLSISKKINTYSSLRPNQGQNSAKKLNFANYLKSDNSENNLRTPTPNFKERPKSKQSSARGTSINSKLGSISDPGVKQGDSKASFFFKDSFINQNLANIVALKNQEKEINNRLTKKHDKEKNEIIDYYEGKVIELESKNEQQQVKINQLESLINDQKELLWTKEGEVNQARATFQIQQEELNNMNLKIFQKDEKQIELLEEMKQLEHEVLTLVDKVDHQQKQLENTASFSTYYHRQFKQLSKSPTPRSTSGLSKASQNRLALKRENVDLKKEKSGHAQKLEIKAKTDKGYQPVQSLRHRKESKLTYMEEQKLMNISTERSGQTRKYF